MTPYRKNMVRKMPEPDAVVIYADDIFGPAMFHYAPEDADLTAIAREHGFEMRLVAMVDDLDDDHPLMRLYCEEGECAKVLRAWRPRSPGDSWKITGCYDTEDGPVALFLKHRPTGERAAFQSQTPAAPSQEVDPSMASFKVVIEARDEAKEQLATLRETVAIRRSKLKTRTVHPDDLAVDRFAAAMKAKLAQKREEGRGGWEDKDDCSNAKLSKLLLEHLTKGDPLDVGNFAMMIHQRGERITAPAPTMPQTEMVEQP
ncbi:MAG: hypothetical protein ACREDP_14495 [Bradyrhizobium sp.]